MALDAVIIIQLQHANTSNLLNQPIAVSEVNFPLDSAIITIVEAISNTKLIHVRCAILVTSLAE